MKSDYRIITTWIALLAIFAVGGCSSGSDSAPAAPQPSPPDTTSPTVSAVEAPGAATLNRVVTLGVTASDNVAVTEVRFFVDGTLLGSDTTSPYEIDWDTSGAADGDHVLSAEAEDAAGNIAPSGEVTITVQNNVQFAVTASGAEEVTPVDSAGSAQASLTINLASGEVQGDLTVSGITATAAHIHDAFAGTNGPVLVPFDPDAGDPSLFTIGAGAMLDATGVERLLAGALYVNVHTDAVPSGELRGQILPDDFVLYFTDLNGFSAVPQVDSVATGRAAITLNQASGALVVQARVEGLDDATQAHVHEAFAGAGGPVIVALAQDPLDTGRWFVEDGALNAAGLEAFAAARLYVNVHSPANPGGEIRGQIVPAGVSVLVAELSAGQEVPAVDSTASGLASLTLDQATLSLTLHVTTNGLEDATASHLHGAFGGVNGPVEIGLTQDGGDPAHWFAEEQSLSAAQLEALLAGATYVNVHSPAHPGGEIRGQVIPDDIVFAYGQLEGRQEVPAVDSAASGTFAVTVNTAAGTVVAHANTSGADDATAAHLHDAFAGTNGGVAIGLAQDPVDVTRWSAIDAPINADQQSALQSGRFYVNVHTPANPGGEIRGQVAPPPIEVLFTTMSSDEEVPPVASAATGIAATTVNRSTGTVTLHLNASGADDATAAHIHNAPAGENGPVLIPLQQDPLDAGHWLVSGAQLDDAGLAEYRDGRLYVNLHTPANPGGEIRGQIVPPEAAVTVDDQAPAVTLTSPGTTVSGSVTLEAEASDDQGVVVVRFLADGVTISSDATAPYSADWDTTTVADGQVTLSAEAEDEAGNVGVSADVIVTVENAMPVTLTQIQTQVFTPMCSGCHSGPTSDNLPSGMNLSSAAASHDALVNVASLQVALDRVEPGQPDNSYLIRKLEGGPDISGSRMPQGGPFLDQETVDMIRQWISDGAPNN